MKIKEWAKLLSANARQSMRLAALSWRDAAKRGDSEIATQWLKISQGYREVAAGYLEAV